jgi:hypothetical protein
VIEIVVQVHLHQVSDGRVVVVISVCGITVAYFPGRGGLGLVRPVWAELWVLTVVVHKVIRAALGPS